MILFFMMIQHDTFFIDLQADGIGRRAVRVDLLGYLRVNNVCTESIFLLLSQLMLSTAVCSIIVSFYRHALVRYHVCAQETP